MTIAYTAGSTSQKTVLYSGLVFLTTVAFSAFLAWVNLINYRWLSPLFEQGATPTSWGIIQRLYLIVPAVVIALLRPRQVGFQVGKTLQYGRMLVVMLVLNMAVIGGYRILTGATPYSGISMVFNEAVTVPLIEEVVWRGIVFAVVYSVLRKFLPEGTSAILSGVFSGICFGLLHSTNALFGYPLAFVALQTLNATVWGIVYGIARAKTGSIYPPVVLHAAMNLVAALG